MNARERDVIITARRFVRDCGPQPIPVDLTVYLDREKVALRYEKMACDEGGYSLTIAGKRVIAVNGSDLLERQRFTICHELAHLVLGLPSDHTRGPSYTGRPLPEILCDVFATELLLPYDQYKPIVDQTEMGFPAIERLSAQCRASRAATVSRFVAVNARPCAYVLGEAGFIRYVAQSARLREMGAWISIGRRLPQASLAARAHGERAVGPVVIEADEWFEDWPHGGTLSEDVCCAQQWNQTLSLLWCDDEWLAVAEEAASEKDDGGLRELDGILPWPSKSKRR